jgi:hypothetical protein
MSGSAGHYVLYGKTIKDLVFSFFLHSHPWQSGVIFHLFFGFLVYNG